MRKPPLPAPPLRLLPALLLALASARASAQSAPPVPARPSASPALAQDDRVRLAEAFALARAVGDSVWPGWSRVPFAVLLVTPDHEFLVGHPSPSADFTRIGHDSLLASDVLVRPRSFPPGLLATFPAVGGVSTVVVGRPAQTGKGSTAWVLTLLHEHFHQLQSSQPGYYDGVKRLDLARGDSTGMWMLNYPFPYDSAPVQEAFASAVRAAAAGDAAGYGSARDRLRASLAPDDYRYLAFQLWQEGVARYTEYAVARRAATAFAPSAAFRALADYVPFDSAAAALRRAIDDGARAARLGADHRVALYPAGAAIALMLDQAAPTWRTRYFERPFSLDH